MTYTTKNNLKTIFFILLFFIFGVSCFNIGLNTTKTVYKTEKILVSDKMNECVGNGGQFSLYFNNYQKKYIINCDIPEKNLFIETYN